MQLENTVLTTLNVCQEETTLLAYSWVKYSRIICHLTLTVIPTLRS